MKSSAVPFLAVVYRATTELVPYAQNPRTHTAEQVLQIAASIRQFGFTNPVLVDADGGIVAGHGRVMAAHGMGLQEVPTITLGHLSEAQKRAYVIADNKLALNAGWDEGLLRLELEHLGEDAFDLDLTGFTGPELIELFADATPWGMAGAGNYTQDINSPAYEPKGERPEVHQLFDATKSAQLTQEIARAEGITAEERAFLGRAAQRHTVFDYHLIAEYYCHASPAMQQLMEQSALVIIDFDKAISGGFVRMSERLDEVYAHTFGDDDDAA